MTYAHTLAQGYSSLPAYYILILVCIPAFSPSYQYCPVLLESRVYTNLNLDPVPQFVAEPSPSGTDSLVITRNVDGSIYWQSSNSTLNITLNGGPSEPNFGYITTNMDGRFYGIADGVIHEYRWYETEDITGFHYVGLVATFNATSPW